MNHPTPSEVKKYAEIARETGVTIEVNGVKVVPPSEKVTLDEYELRELRG